jgi:pyruvate dehydrogenase E1 component alpha subunit
VLETSQRLVERSRQGEGPVLLEAKTYRYYDHQGVKGLRIPYRTIEEMDQWKERDAIAGLGLIMVKDGVTDEAALEKVWDDTRKEIEDAIEFAENSPWPDPANLLDNVYTE